MPHADVRIVRKADGMRLPVRAVQTSPAWMGQAGGMGGSDMNADGFRDKWSPVKSIGLGATLRRLVARWKR